MFTVYIIKSLKVKRYYVGVAEDVSDRIAQHNQGKVRSTKAFTPYKLIHTESFQTLSQARAQESKIKRSGHIERYLKNFMALSSNG
ncbi:MAG: GIY-YIG nuclease family protein [Patescibacteria group bacterium]